MSAGEFYPYQVAPGRIQMNLEAAGDEMPRGSDGAFLLYEKPDLDSVKFQAAISIPDPIFKEICAPSERTKPPVELRIVTQSIESRKRESVSLPGHGSQQMNLKFNRKDWFGSVEIRAHLVRLQANDSLKAEFGSHRACSLAWSDPVRVLFDPPAMPPGKNIEVKWENFKQSNDPWRKRNAGHLFALEVRGQQPMVYLNEGFARARIILDSAGTHGRKAKIRDATYHLIVHQVWTSLLGITIGDLGRAIERAEDDSVDVEATLAQLGEWQRAVVKDWSPYFYPELEAGDSLDELVRKAAEAEANEVQELVSKTANVIQERFMTYRGFEGLAKDDD